MSLMVAGLLLAAVGADEYVGASMPQYGAEGPDAGDYAHGGAFSDYRGLAEPSAALDYKYDDPTGNSDSPSNDIETEIWKKPSRKLRDGSKRRRNEIVSDTETLAEGRSKAKTSRRRAERQHSRSLEDAAAERRLSRSRRRRVDVEASPPLVDYAEKSTYRTKNKRLDVRDVLFTKSETTERIIRRKPRDKYVRPEREDLDFDENMGTDKKTKEITPDYARESDSEHRDWSGGGSRDITRTRARSGGGSPGLVPEPPENDEPAPVESKRYRGSSSGRGATVRPLRTTDPNQLSNDEDEDDSVVPLQPDPAPPDHPAQPPSDVDRPRSRQRNYDYGGNYYDMKRVLNIKNKLPSLLRRPTTRARSPSMTLSTATPGRGAADLFEILYPARRAGAPPPPPSSDMPEHSVTTEIPSPTSTTTTYITPARTSLTVPTVKTSSELTLLERSRLSILKKAQKKEGVSGREVSKKPPVLLQVTSKMPTVVMVEPPTSAEPWMRANAAPEQSPDQLDKVKRLMRHKLISNARSIQDLTDNWDDLVCDYIDTSLLDAPTQASESLRLNRAGALLLLIFIL